MGPQYHSRSRRRSRRVGVAVLVAVMATVLVPLAPVVRGGSDGAAAAQVAPRPNIVVVMTDDQTIRQLERMPNTRQLAAGGVQYRNAHAHVPECCPSRATFLTGQYMHNHGVLSSSLPTGGYTRLDPSNVLPVWLHDAGYYTAHAGKYLNGYGTEGPAIVPPGWDDWWGLVDPTTYDYWGYTINENGTPRTYGTADADYQTDVLARHVVDVIGARAPSSQPFFVSWTPLAPHVGHRVPSGTGPAWPIPAPRHDGALAGQPIARYPDFNEADVSDKPPFIQALPLLTPEQETGIEWVNRRAQETLLAVDDGVGDIVAALSAAGELDETVIIFTSDNGYFYGEHRLVVAKSKPYDPAVRVPLIIRGPGWPAGLVNDDLVTLADLAPTIADLARATPTRTVDGWSLVPGRRSAAVTAARRLLISFGPFQGRNTFHAVRGRYWKYVEWGSGDRELYDLLGDPYELDNKAGDPAYRLQEAGLKQSLAALRVCSGSSCTGEATSAGFHATVPSRILDSRTPLGGWGGPIAAGAPRALQVTGVTGVAGVPPTATAVVLNVTATGSTAGSFLSFWAAGAAMPPSSNLNFGAGETIANHVVVRVGTGGQVMAATAVGATHVVADLVGWFDDGVVRGDRFNGVAPSRILDSRTAVGGWSGRLGAGDANVRGLQVRGSGGVPPTATAVAINVTVTAPDAGSFLSVWPSGVGRPVASTINFGPGQTIANLAVVPIGAGGDIAFFNAVGSTHVVADVVGYFDPGAGSLFHPLAGPVRVLDDRDGTGAIGPWGPGESRTLAIAGIGAVPANATAFVGNVTVTGGTEGSFVTVSPSGAPRPNVSNLNFGPGQTIANLVVGALPANGSIDIYNEAGSVDVVADLVGYFAP